MTESALAGRVERRSDQLAKRMLTELIRQIPLYSHLPQEQLQGEILDILRYNLTVFFRILREGGTPAREDLAEIRASAARRAEERIPLEAVLTAYHVGALVAWEALQEEAEPGEADDLMALVAHIMGYIQTVTSGVAAAYLEERQAIYGEERDARRALAEALLSGTPTEALAQRVGHPLAPSYFVVELAIGPSADEKDEGVGAVVAARRKLRRVERYLSGAPWEDALLMLSAGGGSMLVPVRSERDAAEAEVDRLEEMIAGVRDVAGATVTAGVSFRPGIAGVPIAGEEASEVLRLARELGRPEGVYTLDDVLLEYVLTRPSEAGARLSDVLAPLDHGPELVATLEGYFHADFDRRRAAAALNIHPNTLDYRLRRVAELTGLSVSTAQGLQVLGAALVARRFARP